MPQSLRLRSPRRPAPEREERCTPTPCTTPTAATQTRVRVDGKRSRLFKDIEAKRQILEGLEGQAEAERAEQELRENQAAVDAVELNLSEKWSVFRGGVSGRAEAVGARCQRQPPTLTHSPLATRLSRHSPATSGVP